MVGTAYIPLAASVGPFNPKLKGEGDDNKSEYYESEDDGVESSLLMAPRSPSGNRLYRLSLLPRLILIILGVAALSLLALRQADEPSTYSFSNMTQALELPITTPFGDRSLLRTASIWGPGLDSAVQHESTTFFIDFLDEFDLNSTDAGPLGDDDDLVITLSGPSVFSAEVTYLESGRYLATYRPIDAGDYVLLINTFRRPKVYRGPFTFWLPLGNEEGYKVRVVRSDGTVVPGDGRTSIEVPQKLCSDLANNSNGRWVRCEDVGMTCVRYGWIWMNEDCRYEVLSPAQITSKPLWILFLGTSVKRGTFFAAVDYLLEERASVLPDTFFWKCKGWMDLRIGQYRISHRDFRRQCYSKPHQWICSTKNYEEAAEEMLALFANDNGGPDLVVLEINDNYANDFNLLESLRQAFEPSWTGKFVAGYRSQSPERKWNGTYPDAPRKLVSDLMAHPHWEIGNLDMGIMGVPLFGAMEFPLAQESTSHWHHPCAISGMNSCSVLLDWEFQMLSNYINRLPPRLKPTTTSVKDLKFCESCPKDGHFTMNLDAPVQCYNELPLERGSDVRRKLF